jgi:hypothetical protein
MVHAQTSYSVHLESGEDTGASLNKGTTTINSQVHTLPKDLAVSSGSWIEYSPATGYGFLRWETTGGVFVDTTSYAIDVLNVTGSGTLRAIYTAGGIRLESAQNTGATTNKGILLLLVGHNSVQDFPKTIYLNPGSYPISYQLPTGYTFVGWEATGSVSVSSSTSKSTTLNVVTGSGTLRAIYTAGGNISLESVQDNGASSNKGYIVIDPTAYGGLPTDVTKPPAVYSISYSAESGYIFVRWETVGSMSVSNPTSVSTSLTVTGPGTLRAIYSTGQTQTTQTPSVHLESVEDTAASMNKGTITFDGASFNLPRDLAKPLAVYSISYSPASGYTFVRWETTGNVSIPGYIAGVLSNSLTVTGSGTLRAVYRFVTGANVRLESREDNYATLNKGWIGLGDMHALPANISISGDRGMEYTPMGGYQFVRWEVSGSISVANAMSIYTMVTVTGSGTIRAVYCSSLFPSVTIESRQDNYASSSRGMVYVDGTLFSVLPVTVSKAAGSYRIRYQTTTTVGENFLRWEVSGGLTVANPTSDDTTLTVTGSGTLRVVYTSASVQCIVHLESRQDTYATINKGSILLDAVSHLLPADVSKTPRGYLIEYSPTLEGAFVRWEVSGNITVSYPTDYHSTMNVAGHGTLRAIYKFRPILNLQSKEEPGSSVNKGKISLSGTLYNLPAQHRPQWDPPTGFQIDYTPQSGYEFVRWEFSSNLRIWVPQLKSNDLQLFASNVSYTLTAVYREITYNVRLESRENNDATSNKGTISIEGTVYTLPQNLTKTPGTYSLSFSPPSGYTFIRWDATGGVPVSNPASASTSLTVTGPGTLRAIYIYGTAQTQTTQTSSIRLESVEDTGASKNKGSITLDGAVLSLPTDVTKPPAVYSVSYSPASGYTFAKWDATGGVSVSNPASASTSLTVTGPGKLKAIYSASSGFVISLGSREDNGASKDKGSINLAGVFSLPGDATKPAGVYSVSYSPAGGYAFVKWETTGGVSVSSSTSVSTDLTVSGPGSLVAVYTYTEHVNIHLYSAQNNGASTNKGSINLAGVVSSLPTDTAKLPGIHSISYSPASGYAFVRWETLGGVSVSSSTSVSTSLTVTGPGKLKAIYSITPQTLYRIDLKSGEDGGTTSNAGRITFAAVAYSQLPAQVSKVAGSYSISYTPATGYIFVRWQASGAIVVTQSSSQSTTAKVTGQGTLTAVYRKGVVHRQPLPFGVALSLEPDKQSVQAGQSASFKINVQLVYGSAPAVSLEVTDHPGNANYSFSMPSGTPPYSSDLTISTDPSTPPGTYMCTVTCSALDELDSTSVTLIVEGFKSPSQLSVTTKPNTLEEGESVTVTGSLVPYMSATVQLIYRNPGGAEITRQVSTDTGNFTDTFKPDAAGDWSVKAKWVGDSDFEGSESSLARFSVKASPLTIALPVAAVVVVSVAAALFFYLRKKRLH